MPNLEQIIQQMGPASQPMMNIAQPLNDTQLVALVASHLRADMTSPKEAVDLAIDIVVESIVQMGPNLAYFRQRLENRIAEDTGPGSKNGLVTE